MRKGQSHGMRFAIVGVFRVMRGDCSPTRERERVRIVETNTLTRRTPLLTLRRHSLHRKPRSGDTSRAGCRKAPDSRERTRRRPNGPTQSCGLARRIAPSGL